MPHNLTSSPLLSSMLATARITSRPSQRSFTVGQRLSTSAAGRGPRAAKRQAKRPDGAPAEHGRLPSDSPPPCHRAHTPDCIHSPYTAESNPTRPQTVRRLHAPHSRRSSGHPPTQVTAVRNQMGMARSKMAYSWQVGSPSTGRWPLRAARTCRDIAATSLIWSSLIRSTVVDFQIPSYAADNLGPVPGSDLHLCTLILKPQTVPTYRSFVMRCSHANAHD